MAGRGRQGFLRGALTATLAIALVAGLAGGDGARAAQPLAFTLQGDDARTRVPPPGATVVPCDRGGSATHHHVSDQPLPGGVLSQLAGTVRTNLDFHFAGSGPGHLVGEQSQAALANQRGAVGLQLTAGSCANPIVAFDGTTATGSGTWAIEPSATNGAYREATGSGTFTISTTFAPGNDNPWSLAFTGDITVLQPALKVELVRSFWGHLGADYAGRVVTVIYKLTNTGPGDAFRVQLLPPGTKTGIVPIEVFPTDLDDLSAGETVIVTARYKIGIRGQHDGPLLVRRQFDTTIAAVMPDALDVPATKSEVVTVTAPAYPPAL